MAGPFELSIRKFAKMTADRADLLMVKLVVDIGATLVYRSPVGNPSLWKHPRKGYVGGRFRQNWQYGEGRPPKGILVVKPRKRPKREGASALIGMENAALTPVARPEIKGAALRTHYWANNLPYARRIEHGWSNQAPKGVVGLTVIEFKDKVERLAREINR